jgi:hypothetical protein
MKMPFWGLAVFVGVLIAGSSARAADTPPAPAAPPPKPCSAPENRQFDFWSGSWTVTDPTGKAVVGTNDITVELGGCVLHEHWKGAKGGVGESFNIYDAASKRWHQTWVDASGSLVVLNGGIVDGKMVLEGPGYGAKGEPATNRISWEKLPDGRVRQLWTVSTDGGKSWTTSFDGYYGRK